MLTRKTITRLLLPVAVVVVAGIALMPHAVGQSGATARPSTKNGEWPYYTADEKGTKYSPLDQINGSNFNKLEVAWRFKTDNLGPRPEFKLEGTPLMVKGVAVCVVPRGAVSAMVPVVAPSGTSTMTRLLL